MEPEIYTAGVRTVLREGMQNYEYEIWHTVLKGARVNEWLYRGRAMNYRYTCPCFSGSEPSTEFQVVNLER